MKRKRDLFYDVFGRKDLVAEVRNGPKANPRPRRPAPRELHVSKELVVVITLLVVVFVGTSYYLGSLGGKSGTSSAELSTKDRNGRPDAGPGPARSDPDRTDRAPAEPVRSLAVRVLTARWSAKDGPEKVKAVEASVIKVVQFLERQGFKDILPLRDRDARQIAVYVGRAESVTTLEPLKVRLQKLSYGGDKPFSDAFITSIDEPVN